MINIFDTYKKKIIPLINENTKCIRIYLCGPTVYSEVHIGNLRAVFIVDALIRLLKYENIKVDYASNITDISDKITNHSKKTGLSEKEIIKKYTNKYLKLLDTINIIKPNKILYSSKCVNEMINIVNVLVNNNYAYVATNGVYLNTTKIINYGDLANIRLSMNINQIKNTNKKNSHDFSLWKVKSSELDFKSPWGIGRPSWHLECIAMIIKYFKNDNREYLIDLHVGGKDLIFPHHVNEIAINNSYSKIKLSKNWLHVGTVLLNNKKMSKSLNNIVNACDVIKNDKDKLNILKLCMYLTNITKPLNYSDKLFEDCRKMYEKWWHVIANARNVLKKDNFIPPKSNSNKDYSKYTDILKNNLNFSKYIGFLNSRTRQLIVEHTLRFNDIPDNAWHSVIYNLCIEMEWALDLIGISR